MSTNVHWNTPSVSAIDPRGLPVRHIEYLRTVAGGPVQALSTRQQHDVAGRAVAQHDPRLPMPNTTRVYALNGQALTIRNVDSGTSTNLPGLAGEALQSWDAHNNHRRMTHDNQLRVVAIEENAVPGVETFTYAAATADPTHNLRGQLIALKDPAGHVEFSSFAMTGQALSETRTFHDGKTFSSRQIFSSTGTLLEQTDAGGHLQQSIHDIAGQLTQVRLQLNGQPQQPVLNDAQYNAAGQITEQLTANGVTSRWIYRAADGRLLRHCARSGQQPAVLDDEYTYDRVGNILGILDRTYTPTFFRNQQVDGLRAFTYDSLSRLTVATGHDDAPPADNPGRPQPTDPNDRRNYAQTYEYDHGNNLIKLSHVRDGAQYTREMAIDPASNRGVRWKAGDPLPDFEHLFDRAGNLLTLQPGQPIRWNSYNQLQSVTLAEHASGPHDTEQYRYSQGARVYKRHETHSTKLSHFHEVHSVQSLEIRTRDNGEELHLITLNAGVGNVTCLHWVAGKPAGIDADQMRYTLADHLGSSVSELDQTAQLISSEGYYPFGGTAKMAARSLIEVDYKFVHYSDKETDVSGLIHYGARYYAPWLCRWVSADPAGDADGLNRYAFVGNNPLRYYDSVGTSRKPSELRHMVGQQAKFLSTAQQNLNNVKKQIGDLTEPADFRLKVLKNFAFLSGRAAVAFFAGYHTTGQTFAESSVPGEVQGMSLGNFSADSASTVYTKLMSPLNLDAPILPRLSDLEPSSIRDESAGISPGPLSGFTVNPRTWQERSENIRTLFSLGRDGVGGALIPGVSELAELYHVAKDATRAEQLLSDWDLNVYESMFDELEAAIGNAADSAYDALNELGVEQTYTNATDHFIDIGLGNVGANNARMTSRADIKKHKSMALQSLNEVRATMARYRTYVSQQTKSRAA